VSDASYCVCLMGSCCCGNNILFSWMNGVPLYTGPWLVSPPTPKERFYKNTNNNKRQIWKRNCKVEFFSAPLAKANEMCQNRTIKQKLQSEKDKDKENEKNKNLLSHQHQTKYTVRHYICTFFRFTLPWEQRWVNACPGAFCEMAFLLYVTSSLVWSFSVLWW